MPITGLPPDNDDQRRSAREFVTHASVQHLAAEDTFAYCLDLGLRHGMTIADLCAATGLDEPYVLRLLERAELGRAG